MTTQGQRIKKIRKELNLSQEEFGKNLGVSKQYVSNLEADRNILNNEKLVSLLLDFNVNMNYLLGGVGDMFINKSGAAQYEDVKSSIMQEVETMLKNKGLI